MERGPVSDVWPSTWSLSTAKATIRSIPKLVVSIEKHIVYKAQKVIQVVRVAVIQPNPTIDTGAFSRYDNNTYHTIKFVLVYSGTSVRSDSARHVNVVLFLEQRQKLDTFDGVSFLKLIQIEYRRI